MHGAQRELSPKTILSERMTAFTVAGVDNSEQKSWKMNSALKCDSRGMETGVAMAVCDSWKKTLCLLSDEPRSREEDMA